MAEVARAGYVQLLGAARARMGLKWISFVPEKRYQLLAYLAYQDDWVSREKLAYLFWPDTTTQKAQHNLRQLLHRLRSLDWLCGLEANSNSLRWQIEIDHPHYPHKYLSAYSYFLLATFALLSRSATSLPFLKAIFKGSILPKNETPKMPGRVIAVQDETNSDHPLMTGLLARQLALQAIFCVNSSLLVVGDGAVGARLLLHQPR
jgi:hypothetical protein